VPSDKQIDQAIELGKKALLATQQPNGSWAGYGVENGHVQYPVGPTALATYALLESGEGAQSDRMKMALAWLATNKAVKTYELGIRCNVWVLANSQTKGKYFSCLNDDANTLVHAIADKQLPGTAKTPGRTITGDGSYTYGVWGDNIPATGSDASNSQYGLLGVWAAAQGGRYEVADEYWYKVLGYWHRCQNRDGGWGYVKKLPSSGTMTAAGLASTIVCYDNLSSGGFVKCNNMGEFGQIQRGLDWFDHNFEDILNGNALLTNNVGEIYYFLYGVQRVALASGYRYFGTTDWFKAGAANLLDKMLPGGGWPGEQVKNADGWPADWTADVNTAYALLFLVRGRQPVLFNKLEFASVGSGTDWRCRPRDMAMLTTYLGKQFCRTLNWQIINFKAPVKDWHDAPILYIVGSLEPKFTPDEIAKLRQYVLQGGTIFSCSECGDASPKFAEGIRKVYTLLFPEYEMVEVPATHAIYSEKVMNKLQGRPKFFMITNGVRPLVIHTDEDLPKSWQLNRTGTASVDFQAAENLFMYLTDKGRLHKRGSVTWPDEVKLTNPKSTIKIVRLKWSGSWNPEPLAMERFSRLFSDDQQIDLQVAGPDKGVAVADVGKCGAKVAILSGVGTIALTPADIAALKDFVAKGNFLLVDAAGGDKDFYTSAESILKQAYGVGIIPALSTGADVYNLNLPDGVLDNAVVRAGLRTGPALKAILLNDKPVIFLSREDISNAGLVGYHCYGVVGYDPGDGVEGSAYRVLRNIVLYAAGMAKPAIDSDKSHDGSKTTPPPANTFFDNSENAHHVVFCIDASGSMASGANGSRFDVVRQELLKAISHLTPVQDFHVVMFQDGPPIELPAKRLSPVTPENRAAAAQWVNDVVPRGAGADPVPALKRCYDVLANADKASKGKQIFLLTDSAFPNVDTVLQCVKAQPKYVHVFTYLLNDKADETMVKTLKDIATITGGKYKQIRE
jgi:hypothetical protein